MKRYILSAIAALLILNLIAQKRFNLVQEEKDEYSNIRFIKPATTVAFSNEIALIKSLL